MNTLNKFLVGCILFLLVLSVEAAPSISIASGQAKSGETISVPIIFNTDVSLQAVTLSVDFAFTSSDVLVGTPVASNNINPKTVFATYTSNGNLKIVIAPLPNLVPFTSGVLVNLPVTVLRDETTDVVSTITGSYTLVDDVPNVTGSGVLNSNITMQARVTNPSVDSDGDGLTDLYEIAQGLNPNDANDASLDSDGDGLSNLTEKNLGTNLFVADTDGDGLDDGFENANGYSPIIAASSVTLNSDADGDTLTLLQEYTYRTNPGLVDTDGDSINDNIEIANGLDPLIANGQFDDADNDSLSDIAELTTYNTNPSNNDTDFDGMDDGYEVSYSVLNPNNSTDADLDSESPTPDGLINLVEFNLGTNPMSIDSDGDCMQDNFEFQNGFDPTSNVDGYADNDSDGLNNKTECLQGSNLSNSDTDGDGMKDGFEYTYNFPFKNPATDTINNGSACGGSNPYNNGTGPGNDFDCDTLTNLEEYGWGSNPKSLDSDNDNMTDPDEVAQGRHPAVNEPALISIISTLLL